MISWGRPLLREILGQSGPKSLDRNRRFSIYFRS